VCSRWKSTDISEEHVASIFKVEEKAKREETSVKSGGKTQVACLVDSKDLGDMFFRNVGWFSTNYTPLYPRR
jgi:hypothetical protein